MIERQFYRLPDLATRWGCTVHDLVHLGIQDRAQICVNIYGLPGGEHRTGMVTDALEFAPDDEPLSDEEARKTEAHYAEFERWKARTTRRMPHGIFELRNDTLRFLEMPNAFPFDLGEALKFDGGWWACEFDPPVSINLDHLCMLHEEVQRLDREVFGVAAEADESPKASAPLHPRAEATYLTIIGALLELVRTPRPGRDSDAAVIRELIDNYADKPGISKTTLETKFADARRRLHST